jgi:hypothetical protein
MPLPLREASCALSFELLELSREIMSNALPRLSAEKRIADIAYELSASNSFCAALVGLNPTTLSNALRGIRALDNEVASELLATLTYLIQMSEAIRPFTIPMDNATETRELIHKLQKAGVKPESARECIAKILAGTV